MSYSNESTVDRIMRVVLGIVLLWIGWFILGDGLAAAALKIFGFVPLITGLLGWCPFYTLLGLSTHPSRRARRTPSSRF